MKLINKITGETVAEIMTNHSMTIEEALLLSGYERAEDKDRCDVPDYIYPETGEEVWVEDLEAVD